MKDKYVRWIDEHVPDYSAAYGQCAAVTKRMLQAFPELSRVRGHYYCPAWGCREHWWLEDPDGVIVDPTARQFPSGGAGVYEPWDESQEEPTGVCPNCGDYIYGGGEVCSSNCWQEYAAYITHEARQ